MESSDSSPQSAPPLLPPLLPLLREATAASHQAIEDLLQLEDAALDLPRYQQVIRGFATFLPAWEAHIAAVLPDRLQTWFASRSRLAFLAADMQALGPASQPLPDTLSRQDLSWLGTDLGSAFGSMYVMEGSALGGQVIARQVTRNLGLEAHQGAAYFTGWGAETGALWKAFRQRLEAEVGETTPHARENACRAAVRTFGALQAVFEAQR